jgi:hypothetical protein
MDSTTKRANTTKRAKWKIVPYLGLVLGIGASLWANIQSEDIQGAHPHTVDYMMGALPPLFAFISALALDVTPWAGSKIAKSIKIMVIVSASASAIISATHLIRLVTNNQPGIHEDPWIYLVAWLTPLMIDLFLAGMTGILLVGGEKAEKVSPQEIHLQQQNGALLASLENAMARIADLEVKVTVLPERQAAVTGVRRGNDSVKTLWLLDRQAGIEWDLPRLQAELVAAGRNGEVRPAREVLRRWEKSLTNA